MVGRKCKILTSDERIIMEKGKSSTWGSARCGYFLTGNKTNVPDIEILGRLIQEKDSIVGGKRGQRKPAPRREQACLLKTL